MVFFYYMIMEVDMSEKGFSFKLSKNLYQDLRKLSFVSERSMSNIVRRSLFVYLSLQDLLSELVDLRDELSNEPHTKKKSNLSSLLTVIIKGCERYNK